MVILITKRILWFLTGVLAAEIVSVCCVLLTYFSSKTFPVSGELIVILGVALQIAIILVIALKLWKRNIFFTLGFLTDAIIFCCSFTIQNSWVFNR